MAWGLPGGSSESPQQANPTPPAVGAGGGRPHSGDYQTVELNAANMQNLVVGGGSGAVGIATLTNAGTISPDGRGYVDFVPANPQWSDEFIQAANSLLEDRDKPAGEMPKKKKKVSKIRKDVPQAEIAQAIAKHTKKKATEVDRQSRVLEATIAQEEEALKSRKYQLALKKNRHGFYKAQQERLAKSEPEIQQEFEEALATVREDSRVQEVTIDTEGRIIITTTPLSVEKPDWDEPQEVGQFQIRVDFSQNHISGGVRVLNITKHHRDYDTPTILNTKCCWGNIRRDVDRDFYTQNLPDLVTDMIEYCISPNEQHGYLGLEGDHNRGWEQWFSSTENQPENYNWEQFDNDNPDREVQILEEGDGPAPSFEDGGGPSLDAQVAAGEISRMLEQENRRLREQLERADPRPHSTYEHNLYERLLEIGLVHDAVRDIFSAIVMEAHGQIDRLELRREEHPGGVIFRFRAYHRDIIAPIERLIAPHSIVPDIAQELMLERGTRMVRVPPDMSAQGFSGLEMYAAESPPLTSTITARSTGTSLSETAMENQLNQIDPEVLERLQRQAQIAIERSERAIQETGGMLDSFRNSVQMEPVAPGVYPTTGLAQVGASPAPHYIDEYAQRIYGDWAQEQQVAPTGGENGDLVDPNSILHPRFT